MDDLLRRWQFGWGLCRGLAPAVDRRTALEVTLGLPDRDREFFLYYGAEPGPWIEQVLAAPRPTWMTVTTHQPDDVAEQLMAAGLRLLPERRLLMTIDLRKHPVPISEHEVKTEAEGPLERVNIPAWHEETGTAAHGMMAVAGADAVMHDIQTEPAYRRQGLGSLVMGTLAERALERGATEALLMATVDGAALYNRLGWVPQATMLTAMAA